MRWRACTGQPPLDGDEPSFHADPQAWPLFGAADRHTLLRDGHGRGEAGVQNTSVTPPRPTSLAAVESLVHAGRCGAPLLAEAGQWHRDDRLHQAAR